MLNIHDNEIMSYKVNFEDQKIILCTKCYSTILTSNVNIIFSNVLVHYFEDEIRGSILFDVEEYSITQFIKDNSNLLKKRKNKCWPFDYDTIAHLNKRLENEKYKYFIIFSSCGLNGWVLAKSYETKIV